MKSENTSDTNPSASSVTVATLPPSGTTDYRKKRKVNSAPFGHKDITGKRSSSIDLRTKLHFHSTKTTNHTHLFNKHRRHRLIPKSSGIKQTWQVPRDRHKREETPFNIFNPLVYREVRRKTSTNTRLLPLAFTNDHKNANRKQLSTTTQTRSAKYSIDSIKESNFNSYTLKTVGLLFTHNHKKEQPPEVKQNIIKILEICVPGGKTRQQSSVTLTKGKTLVSYRYIDDYIMLWSNMGVDLQPVRP